MKGKSVLSLFILALVVSVAGCDINIGSEHEIIVSVESSHYYCHECGYDWFGSTMTTLVCPVCESYRIEILED